MKRIELSLHASWSLDDWNSIASGKARIHLDPETQQRVVANRQTLVQRIEQGDLMYGVNTGFGSLCTTVIPINELEELQANLIRSHAVGTGPKIDKELVRLMLATKVRALSKGYSAVEWSTIHALNALLDHDILPVVPSMGSLGASGDLAPLSHLTLVLMGEGKAQVGSQILPGVEALDQKNLLPVTLGAKEGLALINGTQFMLAHGLWLAIQTRRLAYFADVVAAASLIGFDGCSAPFDARIHQVRPHGGQALVAARMRDFLQDSPDFDPIKTHVQDPYSFRCIPQVHGASNDVWAHVTEVMLKESDAVTDNPTVFTDGGDVISAGNFHGQPLALALDYGKMALCEWGSISERRINQLCLAKRGLPAFLAHKPGTESGIMILQYSAASLVSRNKVLSHPSSTDSIDSSAGQEDHVSMGSIAAVHAVEVLDRIWTILAMEWMAATRALDLSHRKAGSLIEGLLEVYRQSVPEAKGDRVLADEIEITKDFLQNISLEDPDFLRFQ
ncbi:MAG: histidine ammonia-lyase [Schleiferiaceae bacterium]|nr:histidine ammonia-lyase [Schleiferiaceae bacterium]